MIERCGERLIRQRRIQMTKVSQAQMHAAAGTQGKCAGKRGAKEQRREQAMLRGQYFTKPKDDDMMISYGRQVIGGDICDDQAGSVSRVVDLPY